MSWVLPLRVCLAIVELSSKTLVRHNRERSGEAYERAVLLVCFVVTAFFVSNKSRRKEKNGHSLLVPPLCHSFHDRVTF